MHLTHNRHRETLPVTTLIFRGRATAGQYSVPIWVFMWHFPAPRAVIMFYKQGVFIKRHRVTREDGSFFTPNDFSVGDSATIYGRTFFLVDADTFTREFLESKGKEQPAALPYPGDPVDGYRTAFGMNRGRADDGR